MKKSICGLDYTRPNLNLLLLIVVCLVVSGLLLRGYLLEKSTNTPTQVPAITKNLQAKRELPVNGYSLVNTPYFSVSVPESTVLKHYEDGLTDDEKLKFYIYEKGDSTTEEIENGYYLVFRVISKTPDKQLDNYSVKANKDSNFYMDPINDSTIRFIAGRETVFYQSYAQFDPADNYIMILNDQSVLYIEAYANGKSRASSIRIIDKILNSIIVL